MSLLLIATVICIVVALFNLTAKAKEPEPAKEPLKTEITPDDFLKSLTPPPAPAQTPNQQLKPGESPRPSVLLYHEQAKKIYECASSIAGKAGITVDTSSSSEIANQIENLRSQLERVADNRVDGTKQDEAAWIDAVSEFVCVLSNTPAVIEARKAEKIKGIVIPAINYHLNTWENKKKSDRDFRLKEAKRVASERATEELRVIGDRAQAATLGMVAGGSFLAFMALALYLLLAKMETNLRGIEKAVSKS